MHFAGPRGAELVAPVRAVGKQVFADSPIAPNVAIPQAV